MNLKTDLKNLDNLIGGIDKKEFITIAGRPGMGKSSLLINIINNVSKQTNDKILYFNLETSKEILKTKIISDNVEIIDTPAITIEEIKNKCEEVSKNGLALVVIDYAQLIRPATFNTFSSKILSQVSYTLKNMVLKLNTPIIILSQLSSKTINDEDKKPQLRDFDNAVALVQDSDKIIFLYKEDFITTNVELLVVKNRYGATGTVKLQFDSDTQTYR